MPLYDCMLLLKPAVSKEAIMDLVTRVGKHIYKRKGVLTEVKSLGAVQLGYGIKKLDGRYYQGQLMQMTMMTPPSFNTELYYLNKEDRLLRWLLVKHRNMKSEQDTFYEDDIISEHRRYRNNVFEEDDDDIEEDEDDGDDEDEVGEQSQLTEG